jgi:uncharacterized protein YjdB/formylglycine-generating enzyme required for sulfatase activity
MRAAVRAVTLLVFLGVLVASCSSGGGGGGLLVVTVSLAPQNATIAVNATQSLTPTVTGSTNTSVAWNATCGTITVTGSTTTYTAPPTAGSCTVTATSTADPTKSATAVINVIAPPTVSAPIAPGETQATCGQGVTCTVETNVEPTRVTITVGGITVGLAPKNASGNAMNIGDDGSIIIPTGGTLAFDLAGLNPITPVNVWLIQGATPTTLLQSAQPNPDGTLTLNVAPNNPPTNTAITAANTPSSSILISATNSNGDDINLQVGITLEGAEDEAGVESVTIAGDATRTLLVGETTQLTATVAVVGNAATTVTWSSSVPTVASVNATGLVTGLAGGTTVITATSTVDPTKMASVTVNVPTVNGVTIAGDPTRTLSVGATTQLTATVTAVGGATSTVTWSSSEPTVMSVSDTGLVTALMSGTATITATSTFDTTRTATITITVPGISSIIVNGGTTRALQTGQSTQLTTTVTTIGEAPTTVSWSTANANIATVTAGGLVTATAAGVTTITATSTFDTTKSVAVSVTVTDAPPQPAVLGLTIDGAPTQSLNVGASVQLAATVTVVGGAADSVTWSSSVPSVATVSSGTVTGVAGGTTIITATSTFDPTKTASVTINVPAVSSVTIAGDATRSLNVDATTNLAATVTAVGGAATTVTWSSSVPSVATVSSGIVTGVAGGTTIITATSTFDPTKTASVTINVPAVSSVTIAGDATRSVNVGGTAQLTATVTAVGGAATTVTWSSSAPLVASVGANGLVTAQAGGTTIITATSTFDSSKKASVTINVPAVSSVTIAGDATRSVNVGGTAQLTATVNAVGGAATTVTWSSSDTSIATVNAGLVTAVAGGSTTITATSTFDPTKTANVTINVPTVIVSVTPANATIGTNATQSITATVTGAINTTVTWNATCGTITGMGNTITYTAPNTAGTCTITARSTLDTTKTVTATVTVTRPSGGSDPDRAPSYISITNESVGAASGGTRQVNFNISWAESWRGPQRPTWVEASDNWDAAWVFIKYRESDGEWQHATLASSGHIAPSGATVNVPSDGMGAFIYRSSSGYGLFTANGVGLQWSHAADGVPDGTSVEVRLFGIEMVFVPQGVFSLGSGGNSTGEFRAGSSNTPFVVSSQSSIELGDALGQLNWTTSTNTGSPSSSTNASFPTGFGAFYVMKHQVTQGEYVNFLNTLAQSQANERKHTVSAIRNAITGSSVGSYATSLPFVASNYMSWADGAAYADWAGLRPMTELEFEKAARGPVTPVANEFAWGSTSITQATGLANAGTITETPTPPDANAVYGLGVQGPVRVGSFAAPGRSRQQAGAGYYGALELSGNLWERSVTVGNAEGRAFTGTHGNGSLDASGNANVWSWPGSNAVGAGFRGGNWYNVGDLVRASHRSNAARTRVFPLDIYGWRGARSAP